MNKASPSRRRPVLESLEGRVVLSASTAVLGGAGQAHVHHLAARKHAAGPVIARLSPDQSSIEITAARFKPRAGVVVIKGTLVGPSPQASSYSPNYTGPIWANVSANVSQPISRRISVSGAGQASTINAPAGQKVPFTVRLVAEQGRFARGQTVVSLYSYFRAADPSVYVYYPGVSAKMVVRLSANRTS